LDGVDPGLRKSSGGGVLDDGSSCGAGFGSQASLVTSLAESGMMCWSSFGAHGAAGSDWVGGSSTNGVDR
jgi:hypothetical protein